MRSALAKLGGLDPTRLDLRLPRPWVCVLLVLLCLGFGVLVGRVSGSREVVLSAAARPQLRLVLPPTATSPVLPSTAESEPAATPSPSSREASAQALEPETAGESSGGSTAAGSKDSASHRGSSEKGGGSDAKGSGGNGHEGGESSGGGGSSAAGKLPLVKHVFLIMLADEPYAAVFGPSSQAPYLAKTLERRGELLVRYYAVAHDELANGIALLSGQGPTPQTEVNCPTFADIAPATGAADEQVLGQGCVYPASTETLAGQLTAKHLTWKAYVEGIETGSAAACAHPALAAADSTLDQTPPTSSPAGPAADGVPPAYQAAEGDAYATFRNPFVYFDSVIDSPSCATDDVSLSRLAPDLKSAARTPTLSYIAPSLCDDGSSTPCAPGRPAGMAAADGFLRRVVPQILASRAYKHGGLLVITVDQAPSTGVEADSSSCCAQPRFPDLPPAPTLPGGGSLPPSGGGQVGALLLSPYVKAGTTSQEAFNHFSLLRTIEDLFGLGHLGYAALPKLEGFGASLFAAR